MVAPSIRAWAKLGARGTRSLTCAAAVLVLAACHEHGDIQVLSLSFTGNHAISAAGIQSVLATHASGWPPWSPRHYFDRKEFTEDLQRVEREYVDRGYPDAKVTDVAIQFNKAHDGVHITQLGRDHSLRGGIHRADSPCKTRSRTLL